MASILDSLLKNNFMKGIYQTFGLRKPFVQKEKTKHYRCPSVEKNGGYITLKPYSGPEIPSSEWENLEYVTYPTDPNTFFAPLTSATGENILRGFWDFGKPDKNGIWTSNSDKAPNLTNWVKSTGANFGRVQLIRQEPNSLREAVWGLHLDDNNRLNPENEGWIIRMWIELTDDPDSYMVLRDKELDQSTQVQIPMPKYSQLIVDSEYLFHGVWHGGTKTRYGLIVSLESTPALEKWIKENELV
ncbi:MAG: hypothetical protein WCK98_06670 [bacterium]